MPRLQSLVLLFLGASAALPAPLQSQAQRELTVNVVNARADPSQPVQGARVSLSFVAGSEKVVDARDVTNRAGQAVLLFSPEAAQRGNLRVEITGMIDLVVFQPADGQLTGLPATVSVRLLPKGSPALLGPAQIEAMLHRLSMQNQHLEQENREVKGALATGQRQKPDDLTAAMTEWAKANGFSIADADKQVQEWAAKIQRRKEEATADQKALAELALKHYGVAAQLFNQTATDIGQSMDEDEKKFLEERRKKLRDLVDKTYQSSNAYRLNLQYHQATQVLEQARDRAAAEHGRYPEDAALRNIWLEALKRAADARVAEGGVVAASEYSLLLTESINEYQGLLRERSAPAERPDWARAQTSLGNALRVQGERSSGSQATESFAQAVQAFRAALEAQTKTDLPQDWAATQYDLGTALLDRGMRNSGAQATESLARAVKAFQAALEVNTMANLPQEWARTETNLGITLSEQGQRSSGTQATELLVEAVKAYRAALEVNTKTDLPLEWARTKGNLGNALLFQAERTSGAQATELLAEAVQANRAALEVYTKADTPQEWARVQSNMGLDLETEGEGSTGNPATELIAQAVEAYRAVLEVRTKAELPQDWAATQIGLANALLRQGERSSGTLATELLAQAVEAYRAALEVYTKADLPKYWALTQNNLGSALMDQGERSSGTQATDLFNQAVQAQRMALEVFAKADMPQDWARAESNLGYGLMELGARSTGAQATDLLTQAVAAFRAALEVYSKADTPEDWARTQNNLGKALAALGDFAGVADALEASLEASPTDQNLLARAVILYEEKLFRYDRAYELMLRWPKQGASPVVRLSLLEVDLTASRFEECEKQAAALDDASIPPPALPWILIRDTMKLACQWGAGEKTAAQETENALLPKAAQLQKAGWPLAGPRHFLASSPAFETGRASWITLFENLEKGDGAATANALRQLEQVMKQ